MEGTISRTARVSVARRNLKKAEGKIPARRTEIAYKAATTGQAGTCLIKPNIHPEGVEVDAAGIWEEGHANYPGRSVVPHWAKSGAGEMGLNGPLPYVRQKSAETIVVGLTSR
jgi:hypothetical protein